MPPKKICALRAQNIFEGKHRRIGHPSCALGKRYRCKKGMEGEKRKKEKEGERKGKKEKGEKEKEGRKGYYMTVPST